MQLKSKKLQKIIFILLLAILPVLNIVNRFPDNKFSGDTASLLLPALSPLNNNGVPYLDYWEYKPPGIMLVVSSWASIFGQSLGSFKFLHLLLNFLISLLLYKITTKILSREYSLLSTVIISIILFSPLIESLLIGSEMFGLLLSLLGLKLLIQDKPSLFWSGFAFATASQMKDPFGFTVFAIIPFMLFAFQQAKYKTVIIQTLKFVMGFISSLAVITAYLLSSSALPSYLEVLRYKSGFLNIRQLIIHTPETITIISKLITELNYAPAIILLLSFGALISLIKLTFINRVNLPQLVVIFYSIGSFIGFAAGRSISSHYLVQIIPPLILTIAIITDWASSLTTSVLKGRFSKFVVSTLFLLTFIIVVLPNQKLALAYIPTQFPTSIVWQVKLKPEEEFILENTTSSDCIVSVYGWGAAEAPVHTQRRTCTRHFLANITLAKWQRLEYYTQVISNPPQIVIYNTFLTDMDVPQFEKTVFNWSKVLYNCYQQSSDIPKIFVLQNMNSMDATQCLIANSR